MAGKPTKILGIDPGTEHSAWLVLDTNTMLPRQMGIENNPKLLSMLRTWMATDVVLAVEWIESFGLSVGKEVFETVYWTGRFVEAWKHQRREVLRVTRRQCKLLLCNSMRANDAAIRTALIDRYGNSRAESIGTKKAPGPLYGCKTHIWSALAVAVTAAEGKETGK